MYENGMYSDNEPLKEKYLFEYSNNRGEIISFNLENIADLYEVIEKFSDFLHGVGFSFKGELGIVDDENEEFKEGTKSEIDSMFVDALATKVISKMQQDLKNGIMGAYIDTENRSYGRITKEESEAINDSNSEDTEKNA